MTRIWSIFSRAQSLSSDDANEASSLCLTKWQDCAMNSRYITLLTSQMLAWIVCMPKWTSCSRWIRMAPDMILHPRSVWLILGDRFLHGINAATCVGPRGPRRSQNYPYRSYKFIQSYPLQDSGAKTYWLHMSVFLSIGRLVPPLCPSLTLHFFYWCVLQFSFFCLGYAFMLYTTLCFVFY